MHVNFATVSYPTISCEISGAGYELVKKIEETGEPVDALYAEVNGSAYQFMLNQYCILNEFPQRNVEECMVLSGYAWTDEHPYALGCYGFYGVQLDANEYVYVKGDKYKNVLENMGYALWTDTILSGTDSYIMKDEAGMTYAVYDDSVVLNKGTYDVTYKVRVLSELDRESYGYVDIAKSDVAYLNKKEIKDNLLDENGEGTITLRISSDKQMEDVVFRYFADEGVELEIFPVEIRQVSEWYDVAADDLQTATNIYNLLSYYNRVSGHHTVYFINDGTKGTERNTTEFLQSVLDENKVVNISKEQFEELELSESFYVITFSESEYNKNLDWDNGYWKLRTIEEYTLYMYKGE